MLSHWCTSSPARHPNIHLVPFCVTACEPSPAEQSSRLGGPDPDPREQQGQPAAAPLSEIQAHQNSLWLSVYSRRLHATLIFPFPLSSKKRGKKKKKRRTENEKASKQPRQTTRTGCRIDSRLSSSICTERKTWSCSLPSRGAGEGVCKASPETGLVWARIAYLLPSLWRAENVPRDEQPPTPEFTAGPCPDGAARPQSSPRRRRLAGNLRSAGASEHLRDSSWVMGDLQALAGTDTFCLSFISERTVREQDKTPGQGAAVQDTARI